MAEKIVIEAEVKSNIGEVSKDASNAAAEFQVMGVSLKGVKAGFASAAVTAKGMFGSIKAGMISTGIGAFVVLIGSLLTFFTKTKKGAELLEVAFAGIGAAVSVITDRVSKFGGAIVKLFKGDVKGAFKDVKGAFTGIGAEIANDVKQATALKHAFQKLRDSERELNVETAQRRADIEELKLIAEDVTKSEEERLEAAEKAFGIENDLLENRIANAEEAVRIQKDQNELNQSMDEDLDALAQKEIELANIRGESVTKQIELNNKINAIEAETEAKRLAAHEIRMQQIEDEKDAREKAAEETVDSEIKRIEGKFERAERFGAIQTENYLNELKDLQFQEEEKLRIEREAQVASMSYIASSLEEKEILDKQFALKEIALADKVAKEKIALEKFVETSKMNTISMGFQVAGKLAEEGSAAAKGIAVAQTIFNTQQSIMKAMADVPYPYNIVQSALNGIMGASAIQKILSTDPNGTMDPGSTTPPPSQPAPQMMSGAFELSGGVEPEAMRAYVVTDEMTSSQNQLANIRRRATI